MEAKTLGRDSIDAVRNVESIITDAAGISAEQMFTLLSAPETSQQDQQDDGSWR